MISRFAFGWQTTMADLALILFMVTAAGVHAQREKEQEDLHPQQQRGSLPAQGEPLAVYRAHPGAQPLGAWLAEQAPDRRQQLTIVARYRPGNAAAAAQEAVGLAQQAGAAGISARIVLEPGAREDLLATLAFDHSDAAMARSLQPAS